MAESKDRTGRKRNEDGRSGSASGTREKTIGGSTTQKDGQPKKVGHYNLGKC
jgi:hypothetical protein